MSGLIEVVADSVGLCSSGMATTRYTDCTILINACFVMSPACRLIIVEKEGFVNIEILSRAACFKKVSVLTSRKVTTLGINVVISTSLYALVCGK